MKRTVVARAVVMTLTASAALADAKRGPMPLNGQFAKKRITFSGGGPNGTGGKEEFSATAVRKVTQ